MKGTALSETEIYKHPLQTQESSVPLIDQMSSVKGEASPSLDSLLHRAITSLLGTPEKCYQGCEIKTTVHLLFLLTSQIRIVAVQKACGDQRRIQSFVYAMQPWNMG